MTQGAPLSAGHENIFSDTKGIGELFGAYGGAVSVCWSKAFTEGLGEFESERAGALTEDAVRRMGEFLQDAVNKVADEIPNGGDRDHFLYRIMEVLKELGRDK